MHRARTAAAASLLQGQMAPARAVETRSVSAASLPRGRRTLHVRLARAARRGALALALPAVLSCVPGTGRPAAQQPAAPIDKVVLSGRPTMIDFGVALNADCTVMGIPVLRVPEPPRHGLVRGVTGTVYSAFSRNNQRYRCNEKPSRGLQVHYESRKGYVGPDTLTIEVIFPRGNAMLRRYNITVK